MSDRVTNAEASGLVTNRLLLEIRDILRGEPEDATLYREALVRICDEAEPGSSIEQIAWQALHA